MVGSKLTFHQGRLVLMAGRLALPVVAGGGAGGLLQYGLNRALNAALAADSLGPSCPEVVDLCRCAAADLEWIALVTEAVLRVPALAWCLAAVIVLVIVFTIGAGCGVAAWWVLARQARRDNQRQRLQGYVQRYG